MTDDPLLIEANPALRHWTLDLLKQDFTQGSYPGSPREGYYRPVQIIFLRLIYSVAGLNPAAYHLPSLIFHTLNSILIFELAILLGSSLMGAGIAGSLFAVHPIGAHELLTGSQTDLLNLCLTLLTLLTMMRRDKRSTGLGFCIFLLALFHKESSCLIPLLMACLLWSQHRPRADYRMIAGMTFFLGVYLVIRSSCLGPFFHMPMQQAAYLTLKIGPDFLLRYVRLLLIPSQLISWRPVPSPDPYWALLWLADLALGCFIWKRSSRPAMFCYLWFHGVLFIRFPALLENRNTMDHWGYAAAAAGVIPAGWLLAQGLTADQRACRVVTRTLLGGALLGYLSTTWINIQRRGCEECNLRWNVRFYDAPFIRYRLSITLLNTSRAEEANVYLTELLKEEPNNLNYQLAKQVALQRLNR
jgi:hypothetical protein